MYIIFETISGNDPRLDGRIKFTGTFWHYTIAYIDPNDEKDVIISWLNGTEVSESVAKADKFASSYNGELTIIKGTSPSSYEDFVSPTSNGDNNYKKDLYVLTEQDEENATTLLKEILTNYSTNHLTEKEQLELMLSEISKLKTLNETQMFMATYFEFDIAYTNGKDKVKEFDFTWS